MPDSRWPTRLENGTGTAVFSQTPEVIGIEITGRCQLRCRHCFNFSGPDNAHELPLPMIEQLLDQMQTWGVPQLRLSGGEPTLHRHFSAIIDACQKRGIRVSINSHGVYPATMLAYLKTAPIDLFIISVDGLQATNDAIRGQGTFKRAFYSCQQLKQAGQQVMIGCHVGRNNRHDIAGLIVKAAENDFDMKISPIRPIGQAVKNLPEAFMAPEQFMAVVAEVNELRAQFPHIKILTDFDILGDDTAADCPRDAQKASCKAGRTMVNINYDGGVYPCAFFVTPEQAFCAGNLYQESLLDIWQRSAVFRPFRIHQKSARCLACEQYQRRCAGGCPAVAHFATGYLDRLDPTCFAHLLPEEST